MTTPESRLADRGWRTRHSVWLLGPLLGLGLGTCFSLLWAGRKLRDAKVTRVALLLIAPTAFAFIVLGTSDPGPDNNRPIDNVAAGIIMVLWIGGAIYAARINRRLLRIRAGQEIVPWYQSPQQQSAYPPQSPFGQPSGQQWQGALGLTDIQKQAWSPPPAAPAAPPPAAFAPTAPSPVRTAPATQAPNATIDVNAAGEETLRGLPGVGPALAKRLIAYRTSNNGLRSLEDLAAAGLPPHILAGVAGLVTFGPYRSGAQPTRGRVLDI